MKIEIKQKNTFILSIFLYHRLSLSSLPIEKFGFLLCCLWFKNVFTNKRELYSSTTMRILIFEACINFTCIFKTFSVKFIMIWIKNDRKFRAFLVQWSYSVFYIKMNCYRHEYERNMLFICMWIWNNSGWNLLVLFLLMS